MKYRLGLDLGTNSIGWAALGMDENNSPVTIGDYYRCGRLYIF